jgi:cytochrome c-type biogenesis protein
LAGTLGSMDNVSFIVAFSAGLLSFLSPCVLSLVPVYLASLGGTETSRVAGTRLTLFLHSVSFIGGFSLIFIVLGTMAGLTGFAIRLWTPVMTKIAASLLIAFGLFTLAALKVPWLNYEKRLNLSLTHTTGYLRSGLIGATFSLGWTTCVGPVLAGILAMASLRATAWQGAFLLSAYSLGLGVPFLALGAGFDSISPLLKRIRRYSTVITIISGLLLISVGVLVLTGNLIRLFTLSI